MVPAIQPSSQSTKTFLRSVLTSLIFILLDLAAGILSSLYLATIMQLNTVQQILSLISTLDLELILSRKKTRLSSRRVHAPRESIGKKGSRIWSLKILRESGTFPNHSFSFQRCVNFCTRHSNSSSKLRAYRTSSQIWLKEVERMNVVLILNATVRPAHQARSKK